MWIYFAKILTPFLAPMGICTVLWLVGLCFYLRGRQNWSRYCFVTGGIVILSFSSQLVGSGLLGALEDDFDVVAAVDQRNADAIVVLGGVTEPPVFPRVEIEVGGGIDRLLHGLRLYRAGKAPVLIFSGGSLEWLTGSMMSEAEQFFHLAAESGVDESVLLLEERSRNTYENALYTHQMLKERGLNQVLLVTSASHMRRAVAAFRTQGVEVIPAPTDLRVSRKGFTLYQLLPTVNGLEKSTIALKEYMGWWVYRLRGWIR